MKRLLFLNMSPPIPLTEPMKDECIIKIYLTKKKVSSKYYTQFNYYIRGVGERDKDKCYDKLIF